MQSQISPRYQAIAVAGALLWPVATLGAPQSPPSAPVTVVNQPANPVPVTGTLGVSGSVTVGNTYQNPVPVTGVVLSGEKTVLLSDHFYTVDETDHHNSTVVGPIDIQDFKSIRVVLRNGSCSNCGVGATAYIQTIGTISSQAETIDAVLINNQDLDIGRWASKTYDVVGTQLLIQMLSDAAGASYGVRVMVFGRANEYRMRGRVGLGDARRKSHQPPHCLRFGPHSCGPIRSVSAPTRIVRT
jgi:hypothetical protein